MFVREGGSVEYSDFLEAILPSLVEVLEGPADYQLRGRRSGFERLAADKLKADAAAKEAKAKEVKEAKEATQRSRLNKAPYEPMGFQVPSFICFLYHS